MSGLFGNSTQTTTQATTKDPYPKAKPLINNALSDMQKMYSQGVGGQTYTGSTVVPMANQTTDAYGGMMQGARKNTDGRGMSGNLQSIMNNGGFNGYQRGALNNFQETANSSYDMNANPGFAGVLQQAQDAARNQVGMTASSAGRYGSGIAQGAVAREVGNTTDRMVSDDFNRFLQRKDGANQNMFNAAQAGIGNMGAAYNASMQPYQTQLGVGAAYEDLYKRTMDDKLRVFNDTQNQPWNQANRLLAAGNLTGQYGSSNVQSTAPGPNALLQGLGQAASIYGAGGSAGLW